MQYHTLPQIQRDLEGGAITLPDLVRSYLRTIDETSRINAFLSVYHEEAVELAEEIQKKIVSGKAGKLAGLVIGIKDVICYEDHALQCSSKILEGFKSQYSATAVQRLLDEDVIIIGRLNCDEFGMGSSNENSAFGAVRNPIDQDRVPGGSSGGSAAAVAANCCHAALGSDTGGSVRQPAAFCGVVGLKPTYSRISRFGLVAYASSFDTIGIVSRSVEDSALILQTMAGHDDRDSTSSERVVPDFSTEAPDNYKIGVVNQSITEGLEEDIRQRISDFSKQLSLSGHHVTEIDMQGLEYALPTYYILTTAEASTNLSRYDGVRYGIRGSDEDLVSMYKKTRSNGFGEEVKRRILLGTFVLSSNYYDAYYAKAQRVRRVIRDQLKSLFEKYDFILLPTTPTTAFPLGEKKSALQMYLADYFTVPASVAGNPAISLPVGHDSSGLPIGLQLIADDFQEDKLLAFSRIIMNDRIITTEYGH